MIDEKYSSNEGRDTLPSLANLLAFEAAAQSRSFAEAAKQLGRTPSAVSHAIRDMEQKLGVPLFKRAGRAVVLTDAGEEYFASVRDALAMLQSATRRLKQGREHHTIRVSALPFFTSAVLLPNLGRFERENPDYELRIETSNAYADVLNGDADIAIRFGRERSDHLYCKPLVGVRGQPIASADYLASTSDINSVQDLEKHTLIHVRPNKAAWREWGATQGVDDLTGKSTLTFDSILGALDAVKVGRGIALSMSPLIETYPGFGQAFVPVLMPGSSFGSVYNFVCRHTNVEDQKIRRTLRWLENSLSR